MKKTLIYGTGSTGVLSVREAIAFFEKELGTGQTKLPIGSHCSIAISIQGILEK